MQLHTASEDGDYFNHILSVCGGVERKNYKTYKNSVALQQIIDQMPVMTIKHFYGWSLLKLTWMNGTAWIDSYSVTHTV